MVPRRFYHISKVDLGETIVLKAKMPASAHQEHGKPRVCFAPTLWQCVHSIVGQKPPISYHDVIADFLWEIRASKTRPQTHTANPAVYVTHKRLTPATSGVSDFDYTNEHWSLSDIEVQRFGYLDLEAMLFRRTLTLTPHRDASLDVTIRQTINAMFQSRIKMLEPRNVRDKRLSRR